ncbi:MAG: hypothetical protein BMS9Abin37_2240 [Acidobacteriota bacterium]|nr:MAG: hypothetical protein BMS9Abin37_2240 [Acidobacteriota bacterium]
MQRKLLLTVPALTLILFASTTAYANGGGGGGGGWWESMSGPGRWKVASGFFTFCFEPFGKHVNDKKCKLDGAERKMWVNLGGSFAWTGEEEDDQATVKNPGLRAYSFEPSVDFDVLSIHDYAPIQLGVGGGVHYFNGEDVGFWRASIEPRISIGFWRIKGGYLTFRYTLKYFFKGFTAADFGDPNGTFDTNGGDWVQSGAIVYRF